MSKEIKAYTGLKEYEKAVKLSTVFIALTDSIYQREKTNAALELETLYDVDEREAHIAEQALKLKIRTISLAFIFFIVLSILSRIVLIFYSTFFINLRKEQGIGEVCK